MTPVIVCPGRSEVLAFPPEFLVPQDGHDKQDGERVADKRGIEHHAKQVAPHGITFLGDALSRNQPRCALAFPKGCNFLLGLTQNRFYGSSEHGKSGKVTPL